MLKPELTGLLLALGLGGCASASPSTGAAPPAQPVVHYLQAMDADRATRYAMGAQDLDGDGVAETLVLLQGTAWCGSGGCTLLVLAPKSASFEERARVTVARAPIRVLPTKSNGWRDLVVRVGGGGVEARDAVLHFDGARYPPNPTVPPAESRDADDAAGDIVIAEGAATQSVW